MSTQKNTWKTITITQAIAVLCFVLMPALITFVVPRTTIELRRVDGQASASITKHILLIVPFRQLTIDSVTEVESHVTSGKYGYSNNNDRRRNRKVHMAGDGSIWIKGRDAEYQVQSNPVDAPVQVEKIQVFLDNPTAEPFVLTATAGWAFTYLLGGVMTGLCALYCLGATLAVGRWLLRQMLAERRKTPLP